MTLDQQPLLSESFESTLRPHDGGLYQSTESDGLEGEYLSGMIQGTENCKEEPPKDKWNLAYLIFFALGVGMLFPWNVFINANDYFRARFHGSPFYDNYSNFFSIGYMLSNVIWLAIALQTQNNAKPMRRIIWALIVNATIFLACLILTQVHINHSVDFYSNLIMVIVCGSSTAYLQNGVFGLASIFPPIYVQAVMSGQGLAGAAVSVSQILTIMARGDEKIGVDAASFSAFLYFTFAFAVLILCVCGSLSLKALPVYKYYTTSSSLVREEVDDVEKEIPVEQSESILRFKINNWSVFIRLFPLSLAVFLVFTTTLSVFPSITALVRSVDWESRSPFSENYFTPAAFLIFSLGDWFGKALPGFPAIRLPRCLFGLKSDGTHRYLNYSSINGPWKIFALTVSRLLFIPLILFSNTVVVSHSTIVERHLPLWLDNDVVFYVMIAAFAISNGWLGSLTMMHGPQLVAPQERGIAGTIMVFCLTTGLAFGSGLSFVLRSALCNWCNPFVG